MRSWIKCRCTNWSRHSVVVKKMNPAVQVFTSLHWLLLSYCTLQFASTSLGFNDGAARLSTKENLSVELISLRASWILSNFARIPEAHSEGPTVQLLSMFLVQVLPKSAKFSSPSWSMNWYHSFRARIKQRLVYRVMITLYPILNHIYPHSNYARSCQEFHHHAPLLELVFLNMAYFYVDLV